MPPRTDFDSGAWGCKEVSFHTASCKDCRGHHSLPGTSCDCISRSKVWYMVGMDLHTAVDIFRAGTPPRNLFRKACIPRNHTASCTCGGRVLLGVSPTLLYMQGANAHPSTGRTFRCIHVRSQASLCMVEDMGVCQA